MLDLLRVVVNVFNQSCAPIIDEDNLPTYETSSSPFYKLLSLYEALICGPSGPNEKGNWKKLIDRRLHAFRSGQIHQLYQRAHQTVVTVP
ncbi:MAG: hypothetical protein ACREOZ_03870, partial [Gloeomargaritales cyanobacterium]